MHWRVVASMMLAACGAPAPARVAPPPPAASASAPPVASAPVPDSTEPETAVVGPPIQVIVAAPPAPYLELGEIAAAVPQIVFRGDASGSAFCPGITPVRLAWDGPVPAVTFVGMILPVAWRDGARVVATGSVLLPATWAPSLGAVRSGDLGRADVEAPSLVESLGPRLGRAVAACALSGARPKPPNPKAPFDRWTQSMTLERAGCVLAKRARAVAIEDSVGMLFALSNESHTLLEVSATLGRHDDRLCIASAAARIPEL